MPKNSLNIKQVRKDLNLTQQQFADKISVPIGRVNAWEMRGSTPKVQDYNSIIKLLEENQIVLKEDVLNTNEAIEISQFDYMEVSYLPIYAQAGYLNHFNQNMLIEDNLPTILVPKEFDKGNYLVIEVNGDSMDDGTTKAICEGDRLLIKELNKSLWNNKLNFNRYLFVIVHKSGLIVKQVTSHNVDKGKITCHSFNNIYEDFELSLSSVFQLFYVKKIIERKITF